ncbi:hypothetical protein [Rhodococcoides trifolii]|nr:hypothetical protein [Rhodococcus trifolii]
MSAPTLERPTNSVSIQYFDPGQVTGVNPRTGIAYSVISRV